MPYGECSNNTIYLDNAATSWPKPPRVIRAVTRFLVEGGGAPGRAGHRPSRAAERIVNDVRARLARLLNASDHHRIIICFNGTDALNIAIKGALREGDHVVCSALDHNSVSRPLEAMARDGVITLTRVPVSGDGCIDPDAVRRAMTRKTRLATTVHASNVTGCIQPVTDVGRIAREHDALFLMDAAQSAGVLDVDVEALHADLVAFPGHKSLLGPPGTGALYVGPRAELRPFREGGTGADSVHPVQPEELPTRLEAGCPNMAGLAGLTAALAELTPTDTLAHERSLLERLAAALAGLSRVRIVGQPNMDRRVGVLSLSVDHLSPPEVAASLDASFNIAVRPGLHCAPYVHRALGTFPDGTIRIAPGWSTTSDHIDTLIDALTQISSQELPAGTRTE